VALPGVEGAELIGIPPAELWPYISFVGGVGTHACNPEAAAAFLACLAAAENDSVLTRLECRAFQSNAQKNATAPVANVCDGKGVCANS
jgi:hypothetical protein